MALGNGLAQIVGSLAKAKRSLISRFAIMLDVSYRMIAILIDRNYGQFIEY